MVENQKENQGVVKKSKEETGGNEIGGKANKEKVRNKKEKEESKKKDGALRKYESFYREVKTRSAQKAAQKQIQQGQPVRVPSVRGSVK